MKLISHRGNIIGPNFKRENSPSYIDIAISSGYDVEIDINFLNGNFYLGHDTPDYQITDVWMIARKTNLWFHCKNLNSATELINLQEKFNIEFKFFCHSVDTFVLTSNQCVWVHDLSLKLDNRCIIPLLSEKDIINYNSKTVYAVCTDYITLAEYNLKQKGLYI